MGTTYRYVVHRSCSGNGRRRRGAAGGGTGGGGGAAAGVQGVEGHPGQINKLKELRKKRLWIKAKFDAQKRVKEATKSCESVLAAKSIEDDAMTIPVEVDASLVKQHKEVSFSAPKKHQKLYWGLDTRERWERKSNM